MLLSRSTMSGLALLALAGAPALAHAEPDEWGDHRLVPRIDGSEIVTYRFTEYMEVTLPRGPRDGSEFEEQWELDGHHTQLTYRLHQPQVTTRQVKRAYTQTLESAGFDIAYTGSGRDELGRRFQSMDIFDRDRQGTSRNVIRFARSGSDRDKRFFAAWNEEEEVYVTGLIYNNRTDEMEPMVRLDVLEVQEDDVELAMAEPEPPQEPPTEPDEIVSSHESEDLSAEDIEAGIVAEGRVAVRDILFEFDSAEIIDESADALATIAEVLDENRDLELLIVGHTDNVGDFEYNLNLSMERAQAVSDWLEERHDLDGERLQAAGAGMMAPVATNRTDEGREQNRRVELVEL